MDISSKKINLKIEKEKEKDDGDGEDEDEINIDDIQSLIQTLIQSLIRLDFTYILFLGFQKLYLCIIYEIDSQLQKYE